MVPGHDDGLWGIGELAGRVGVTVKTVRFYSERGLLPEASRSSGGHRRYGRDALGRLRLIRSLRALDLPLPQVRRILDEDAGAGQALEDVVDQQLRELGTRLVTLRWREAALRMIQESSPQERADRLLLLGAVTSAPNTDSLVRFWRRWLPPRMPARAIAAFMEQTVPEPPDNPTPAQVLAFARLHAYVTRPCTSTAPRGQPAAHRASPDFRPAVLYDGLGEAYALAAVQLRRERSPHSGEALDCFVAAYAAASGTYDGVDFRRRLAGQLAQDPQIDRYWELTAEVIGPIDGRPPPTPGSAHDWLLTALTGQIPELIA
ncbi:MerR family transcriptional regulator [Streptomyces sp. A7024]|uniref:MerR family transcriptional regulator n=1 Tax=Streptomyces coryli TaxID=1128680 RepID=A0A6G4TU92_9ACTN|nr:MerR family transcriptional regulator [Streptomyces coryli]